MIQGVPDALLAFRDEFLIVEEIAQPQQAVGVIGRLLVSPPVFAIVAVSRNLACPEASVVGVGEGVGMSRQPRLLPPEEFQEPTLRRDVSDEAFAEGKLGAPAREAQQEQDGNEQCSLHDAVCVLF